MSFVSSVPSTTAGETDPSRCITLTLSALATTCALVTTMPSAATMKPVPSPGTTRC